MENALATLVGQPASTFHFATHEIPANAKPPRIPAGLPSRLLERRPDVAEAERNLAASNARVGVAVAAFFPRITLTGAAGFESATVTDLFNWESHLWQIGPSINLPIFEGFRNQANLQAAHARYDQSVAQYRQQVLVAFQDVENALADLRTLAAQSEQQNLAVGKLHGAPSSFPRTSSVTARSRTSTSWTPSARCSTASAPPPSSSASACKPPCNSSRPSRAGGTESEGQKAEGRK